ncbi:ATP-dependent DNA helicase RecG [Corynebacterium sp. HS2168-gen11]|uniref:ATP-dependent DNA helicase RecG n=1 Tax=Corynebacterium sp. HS2168-gen11 TaxID=2974027 RepID=UPI00216AFF12|nr:ATP-dependent DNA helicase RecG [Corynebacterium sp. HS2168-gen11]MCS4534797.1 ATP-dependent DNA helicase RecG [Corynebacterium sp. HS2168-gen11]
MLGWHDSRALSTILPAKESRALAQHFGYKTVAQLLGHFPRKLVNHRCSEALDSLEEGEIVTCIGEVVQVEQRDTGQTFIVTVTIYDGVQYIKAAFFRARWLTKILTKGTWAMFTGKLKYFRNEPQLQHPDYIVLPTAENTQRMRGNAGLVAATLYGEPEAFTQFLTSLDKLPIYPATKAVPTWRILAAVAETLKRTPVIPDPLGDFAPADLPSFDAALRGMHQQDCSEESPYRARFIYDEALALQLVMALRRREAKRRQAYALQAHQTGYVATLIERLPYTLTSGQQQVVADIAADMAHEYPMQRLLQGEVGSGKTIVSVIAMLQAIDNNKQAALLAPTEVLAQQHGRSVTEVLHAVGLRDIRVVVLTGSMSVAAKKQALLDIISGEADIVIGTHALLQASVDFFDLALCVVDEQHRFGVEQRDALRTKGRDGTTPHVLVMTATPIPRTVAMTYFGDLEQSQLTELPGGRKPITSYCVPAMRPTWFQRVWQVVREHVANGQQAYVVCPRIQQDGGVEAVFARLEAYELQGLRLGMLHGQMHADDKEAVIQAYSQGELDVLVSTTVIEVGIDVANASVMVVLEAEKFGASQLHQLRGRVGRGSIASLCFFVTNAEEASPSFTRISQLAATTDGFEVAALDLAIRKEGDVLGAQQSGATRNIQFLDVVKHSEIIQRAHHDAAVLVAEHNLLAQHLVADFDETQQEFLTKT